METSRKIKYSGIDRLILGENNKPVDYEILEAVMPFWDCLFFQLLFRWSMLF